MCDYLGEQIVFLISQPRSGSTLLQFILNSHPEIHTTPEPWLMLHPLYALRKKGLKAEYNAVWASTHVEEFLTHIKDQEEAYFLAIRKAFSYLYSKALEGSGKNMFLDKTPRYYYIIPHLSKVFPSAKFIILLRNPLAVLASILTTWVKDIWQKLILYRDDLLKAPRLLIEGIDLLGSHCSIVQYEQIVREPEKTIKNLCDGLNITFYPEMLKYAEKDRPKGD